MMPTDTAVANAARDLATNRILNDPSDEELILAVQDALAPNKPVVLTDYQRKLIIDTWEMYMDALSDEEMEIANRTIVSEISENFSIGFLYDKGLLTNDEVRKHLP